MAQSRTVPLRTPITAPQATASVVVGSTSPRNAFTELLTTTEFNLKFAIFAAVFSAGLGALHALEPGHGKTIVAAYLVGTKGTARHALLLGLIVTASHTAAVYLLGALTLYAQQYILPDRVYPFLGVLSGIIVAATGLYLLLQRIAGPEFAHSHGEGPDAHSQLPNVASLAPNKLGLRNLTLLGITGGMVPCPAALVVLLSAVSLHRAGLGLFLILAFSLGLAAVLIAMGLAAVYARKFMSHLPVDSPFFQQWMPIGSAAFITALGCVIVFRALLDSGLLKNIR